MEASSSKMSAAPVDIKKLVNQIFSRRGAPEVKNFPKEFADGSKLLNHTSCRKKFAKLESESNEILVRFQELFNILYDERIDCKLVRSNLLEDRMLNWNRINGKLNKKEISSFKISKWMHKSRTLISIVA